MISKSLKEKVYSAIFTSVVSGKYPPGTYINERALCEELSVSRAPVREALIELCFQNILQSVPRQGYLVVRCTENEIRDLIEFRILLECNSLQRSFENITPTQIAQLDSVVQNEILFLRQDDVGDYWNTSINFHMTLASYAQNAYIYKQLYEAMNRCMRAYLQLYWHEWSKNGFPSPSKLHAQIVSCIRDHDMENAIELLRQDIDTFSTSKRNKGDLI